MQKKKKKKKYRKICILLTEWRNSAVKAERIFAYGG